MKKFALLISIAGLFLFSCAEQPKVDSDEIIESFTVAELYDQAINLDGSVVHFEGVLIHTCRHSGDKMHIVDEENENYRVRVNLGEFAGKIGPEQEGKNIAVTGKLVVTEIPESLKKKEKAHVHGEDCDHEEEGHVHDEDCDHEEHHHVHGEDCDHEEEHEHDHDCEHDEALKKLQKEVVRFHIELISYELF